MTINKEPVRKTNRELASMVKNDQESAVILLPIMMAVAVKSYKVINFKKTKAENAQILFNLFKNNDYNGKTKKVINYNLMEKAESSKKEAIKDYIKQSEKQDLTFYLASSHTDSAADHKPWQGKLYYDEKHVTPAAQAIINQRHMRSIQWVMDSPVWFITRPNCRHFFKAIPTNIVAMYGRKELTRRYKMHRKVGDRALATPRHVALEEYRDRLQMLEMMYNKHPTEFLRRDIQKTKLLIKKWEKTL